MAAQDQEVACRLIGKQCSPQAGLFRQDMVQAFVPLSGPYAFPPCACRFATCDDPAKDARSPDVVAHTEYCLAAGNCHC